MHRFRGLFAVPNLARNFARGSAVEAAGGKSQRKIGEGGRGRDDSIVIAGRWRAPQLTSDHGSRGRSRSLLRRLRCLTVKLRI